MEKVKMAFPKNENLISDGKIHTVSPISVFRIEDSNYYYFEYNDENYNNNFAVTILEYMDTEKELVNRPLVDYENIIKFNESTDFELVDTTEFFDTMGKNISLGRSITTTEISQILEIKKHNDYLTKIEKDNFLEKDLILGTVESISKDLFLIKKYSYKEENIFDQYLKFHGEDVSDFTVFKDIKSIGEEEITRENLSEKFKNMHNGIEKTYGYLLLNFAKQQLILVDDNIKKLDEEEWLISDYYYANGSGNVHNDKRSEFKGLERKLLFKKSPDGKLLYAKPNKGKSKK